MIQQELSTECPTPISRPAARGQAGFTVVEMVVTLLVFSLLMVAMLALFDMSNKMARAQTYVADMQQSLRIGMHEVVHTTRIAARGPGWSAPLDFAIAVENNVGDEFFIDGGSNPQHKVLPGTDVLTLRGVLSGSLYRVQPIYTSNTADGVSFEVEKLSPEGVTQDLAPLIEAQEQGWALPIVAVSSLGEYGVGVLDPEHSRANGDAFELFLSFGTGDEPAVPDAVMQATGVANRPQWPIDSPPRPVVMFAILEEMRFYIRENPPADPTDPNARPQPRLSMARVEPMTQNPWGGNPANLRLDIADNLIDLQIALLPPGNDLVRLNLLARTQRQEASYVSPPIEAIEDRIYGETEEPLTDEERWERMHHRRLLQTVVNLRNL